MSVLRRVSEHCLELKCPGCGWTHEVHINPAKSPCWEWNGDLERPTLSPSIRVQWVWGTLRARRCCHFFVRDGRIEFCADSTHELAGQTVPMKQLTP